MRRTESHIWQRIADLMRAAAGLLRSALMLTVAVVAVLFVVSCSGGGGDDPDVPGPDTPGPNQPDPEKPIAFSAIQQEETVTRATQALQDLNVTSFRVWGYKNMSYTDAEGYGSEQVVFPGYTVAYGPNTANTTSSNTNDWEYVNKQVVGQDEQTIKYWDWSVSAYRFFAVTHAGKTTVTEDQEGHQVEVSFTVDAKDVEVSPFFSRLWLSNGNITTGNKPFGQPVQLEFLKPFSTVRYKFIPSDPTVPLDNYKLTLPSFGPFISGKEIAVKGKFHAYYPLRGTVTTETWEVTDVDVTATSFNDSETDYTVLPAKNQGAYELKVTVNGDERTTFVPAEYMDWLPGYEYTYIFKVNEEGGVELGEVFTAYTEWMPGKDGDHFIYNW